MKRCGLSFIATSAIIFGFIGLAYGHGMRGDQRNLAIGPDGLVYVIVHSGMMGPGPGHDGVDASRLLAIDPAGGVRWRFDIEGFGAVSAPSVAGDGTVYLTATAFGVDDHDPGSGPGSDEMDRGVLFAVKNGQLKWTFAFHGTMASAPVLAPDGTIYFTAGFVGESGDMGPGPDQPMGATLFALRDAQTQPLLAWTVIFDALMISEPIVRLNAPGYPWVIYASVTLMEHGHGHREHGMREVELYEIYPDGRLRRIY